ncbi:hypothetical protein [Nocardioides litoris]|uniref:hypothetical protein n=1 Tax=Nocardioides litoris TaxID=1926648 RepID=UPI00111D0E87|nr:hypothetical protein [Nocardioides litoris]
MRPTSDLDLGPLTDGVGLGGRLRAIGADNLLVLTAVVGLLLLLVPLAVLVGLLATGNTSDGGALVLLAMLVAAGAYVVGQLGRTAGASGGFAAFARCNGLELVTGVAAPSYAGSDFAAGTHVVRQAVRTRGPSYVEVGERFRVTTPGSRPDGRRPEVYLRVLLHRPWPPVEALPAALRDRAQALSGTGTEPVRVEVAGAELTVLGSRPLEVRDPARVAEAFALADALVAWVAPSTTTTTPAAPEALPPNGPTGPTGRTRADLAPRRGRGPVATALAAVALLVVGPVAIAVFFSAVDDDLGNEQSARFVVGLVVLGALAVVGAVVRWLVQGRR